MGTCYIFGAGERCGRERVSRPEKGDLIIAADGGLKWVEELGLTPDRIIGDFDSLGFIPEGSLTERLPVRKDDTDMGVSLKRGLALGYRSFVLYGGTGGRADHTMANYQLLSELSEHGAHGFLVDDNMTVFAAAACAFEIRGIPGGDLSVFSFSDASEGVSIENACYELFDGSITNRFPIGVSNSFTDSPAKIRVKKGTLLIMGAFLPRDVRFLAE